MTVADASRPEQNVRTVAAEPSGLGHLVRGFGLLTASSLLGQLIGVTSLAYVIRRIGPANWGAYAFAATMASGVSAFVSLGLEMLSTRDIAQGVAGVRHVVLETLAIQVALAAVLYAGLVGLGPFIAPNHEVASLLPIVSLSLLIGSFTFDWALLAVRRTGAVAVWRFIGQAVYGLLVLVFVTTGRAGTFGYAWSNIVGLAATAIGISVALRKLPSTAAATDGRPSATMHLFLTNLLVRARRSVPFAYSLMLIQAYGSIGTLLLGYLGSSYAVGVYAAAGKLPAALAVLAGLWMSVFFPHLSSRVAARDKDLATDFGRILTFTLVIAMAVSVGAFVCDGAVIRFFFGTRLHAAALPFALLSVMSAFVLVEVSMSNLLFAVGRQRFFARVMTGSCIALGALSAVLIPAWGALGAAIAALAVQLSATALNAWGVTRIVGRVHLDSQILLRGALAAATMGAATLLAQHLAASDLVTLIFVALAYLIALSIFRPFPKS